MNMIGAGITHLKRNEYANLILNIILFALVAYVAYGRFVAVPLYDDEFRHRRISGILQIQVAI